MHVTDRSRHLRQDIEASGYYPDVVADAVFASVAGEPVEAHLVHHEPTIDERDEVRRHVTVLVLTPTRLILAHTDEHAPDDLLPAAYELARRFTEHRSPVATALARQMLYRNSAQPHPLAAHRIESLAMFYTSVGDGKEGVAAFLEKRPASFGDHRA